MKRLLLVTAALVLALGLVGGCVSVPTYDDEGQTINISVGEQFVIALGSNQTTGYSWQGSYDAAMLELVNWKYEEEAEEDIAGAGGIEYFRFEALAEGETEIILTYSQSWEGEGIGQTKVFTIVID